MLLKLLTVTGNVLEILQNLLKQVLVQETLLTGWCFSSLQVTQIRLAGVQFRLPDNCKKG